MTFSDFLYIIGSGVSFIMAFIFLIDTKDSYHFIPQILILSGIASLFSWAIPIFWLGRLFIKKHYGEK